MTHARLLIFSLLSFSLLSLSCGSLIDLETPSPQPDTPRYTSEEVVDLVKSFLTKGAVNQSALVFVQSSEGSADYIGKGLWRVKLIMKLPESKREYAINPQTHELRKFVPPTIVPAGTVEHAFDFRESTQTVVAHDSDAAMLMSALKHH